MKKKKSAILFRNLEIPHLTLHQEEITRSNAQQTDIYLRNDQKCRKKVPTSVGHKGKTTALMYEVTLAPLTSAKLLWLSQASYRSVVH